jgi:signal transduction histidine kinase
VGRRLILGAAYLLVVVVAGLAVPFGVTLSARLTQELGGRVEREAFSVSSAIEDPIERGAVQPVQPLIVRFGEQIGGRILVTDGRGILLADSQQAPGTNPPSYASRPEIATALAGTPNWAVRSSRTLGHDILVSCVPIRTASGVIGTVRISYPMAEVRKSIRRAWWFLGAVGAVTLAFGLALAVWLSRWATHPLKRAAEVARSIAGGDLDARVSESGPPEVQELARDLNAMTERLGDLLRANREFAANASHQLRTPLTALRLTLEGARSGADPSAEIGHALEETDRLSVLVDSLLLLGEAREGGPARTQKEIVDLRRVAAEAAAELPSPGPVVEIVGSGLARADPERVRQVVANILTNAHRFARSAIRVTVSQDGRRATVTIDDDGPGVPDEARERVFDRFTRGPSPRGPGAGLGLAVARDLARAEAGTISVSQGDLGGARFEVSLPAAN